MMWERPWVLLLLLFVPLLWRKPRVRKWLPHSDINLLRRVVVARQRPLSWVYARMGLILRSLAVVFGVLAIAEYRVTPQIIQHQSDGLDIVLAVDTSGSMAALDFNIDAEPADRLTVVKKVIKDFVAKRPEDRFALVVFGSDVYTQAPLTSDHAVIEQLLQGIRIGGAGDGTAIGDSLAVATKRIKDVDAPHRIIILLTDGEQTAGTLSPKAAAEAAQQLGVKIYTIGVGKTGKVPMPATGIFGQKTYAWTESRIDEETLKNIAAMTGGEFFRAYDTADLEKIYETIAQMETRRVAETKKVRPQTIDWPMMILALFFLSMEHVSLLISRGQRLPC
jgi:Ca-activated chloride channel family protein